MNPNLIRKPTQTSLIMYVLCVHLRWRRVPTDPSNALTAVVTLCRAKMAGCFDRCGHLMACPKTAYLYSIIQQVLASNFGISLLRLLQAALYPGRGYDRQTPVRRV